MELIVGHTTHESSCIWVRGDRRHRRLEVELEELPCAHCRTPKRVETKNVEVTKKSDYTRMVRFDRLEPNTPHRVTVRSETRPTEQPVQGRFWTFSEEDGSRPFTFLHGSCHLPPARLMALGAMGIDVLAAFAVRNSLKRPLEDWHGHELRGWLRWLAWPGFRRASLGVLRCISWLANIRTFALMRLTRFEQPRPEQGSIEAAVQLPSPFANVVEEIEAFDYEDEENVVDEGDYALRPAFMIHAGDQVYFDLDFPRYPPRNPTKEHYRRTYRQAWFEDEATRRLLALLPQYMILDDHEIWDGFGNDPADNSEETSKKKRDSKVDAGKKKGRHDHRQPALDAYDEYVSSRQPQRTTQLGSTKRDHHKGYTFRHGTTGFFVLDTRTQREPRTQGNPGRMIDDDQMAELEKWLTDDSLDLKFIVSGVPFVARLRDPGSAADKWSGPQGTEQRKQIIARIYEQGISEKRCNEQHTTRLIFLVGDLHCGYHATMQIGPPQKRITIHELAGGPFNQLLFAKRHEFYSRYCGTCKVRNMGEVPWASRLEAFHGAAPGFLRVSVQPESAMGPLQVDWRVETTRPAGNPYSPHELEKIIRELETAPSRDQVLREHRITPETFFRWKKRRADEAKRSSDGKQDVATMAPHPLCGRIRFPRPVRS